ncbi:MAG: cytochrome c [Gammaproteobacteria bacterium]|nr:cytochrome c [Gammaproteobacteria bacterium]
MQALKLILVVVALAVVAFGVFLWSGAYNVGADDPHWSATTRLLTMARERSIKTRSREIHAPDLDDPRLIAMGAAHYAEMCTGCHLAPGMPASEMRKGLYPKPPVLYKQDVHDPAEAFWVIKHGIKMTAMPAWGASHDDQAIWAMVAFLKKLPDLTPEQYRAMTADAHEPDEHGRHASEDMPEMHGH